MKKIFKQSFIAVLILTFFGCSPSDTETPSTDVETQKKPTADFSFSGNNNPAPAVITFVNNSTNATTYLWEFGDDSTSFEKEPSHTYAVKGTYNIKLTSTGTGGTVSVTKTIVITAPPTPTTVKINKITITEMVFLDDNGNYWDSSTNGPDVQFFIVETANYTQQLSSSIYNNILVSQLPLTWVLTTPKLISNLSKEYDFSISEIDGIYGNSIANFYAIKMSDYTTGSNAYPKTITLNDTDNYNGTSTIVLDVTWQ